MFRFDGDNKQHKLISSTEGIPFTHEHTHIPVFCEDF